MDTEPDVFNCTVQDWSEMHHLVQRLASDVRESDFTPDVVIGLARGGWAPARCMCDFLEMNDLTSIKIEHYGGTGTDTKDDEATLRYSLEDGAVDEKDVLVVDDIVDTGKTLQVAVETLTSENNPSSVRTATMQVFPKTDKSLRPDFYAEELSEWAWVIYPWNTVEDFRDLLNKMEAEGSFTVSELKDELTESYGLRTVDFSSVSPSFESVLFSLDAQDVITVDGSTVTIEE